MSSDSTSEAPTPNSPTVSPLELETPPDPQAESTRSNALSINVKPVKKSTYKEAFLNLYKCCIGSGILAAPYTFYQGGYILTTAVYFLVGVLMIYSQLMLLRILAEVNLPNMGFTEITRHLLGDNYVLLNRTFVVIMQWGVCASYVLFFMEFFEYAIYHTTQASFEHQLVYLGFALIIIVPLIFINNMAMFTKFSAASNSLIIFVLLACIGYFIVELVDDVNYNDIPIAKWQNIPLVLGVAMYSFEAIGSLLNIRLSMQKVEKFPRLMVQVFTIVTIQFWVFGLMGALSYGHLTNEIILFSLGKGSEAFQIIYALALLITLPLQLLPAFQLIERMTIVKKFIKYGTKFYLLRRTLIRVIQVLMIAGLAIGIPQFAVLISFIGGLAGAVLQFYFPLMFYLRVDWKQKPSQTEGYCFIALMIFGCILGSIAVIDSIYQIVVGKNE